MGRVALRGIRAHLVRFLLSLLAVALGVAFVAGTFSLRAMMSSTFDGIVDAGARGDAYVRGAAESGSAATTAEGSSATHAPISLDLLDQVAAVDGVAAAVPEVQGSIVLVGADGTAVLSTQAPSMAFPCTPGDPSMEIVAGRAPERAGEVALEKATLESSGLAVGDTTTAVLQGELTQVEVVGEVDMGGPMAGATIVLVDQQTGLDLFAPDGQITDIAVYGADGVTQQQLVDRVGAVVGSADVEVVTGDAARQESKDAIAEMLGFITTFLLVFAGIALFVGAFIISNTFAMSVRQRMREFALLRAVGASPLQVFVSILVQAAVVGLVGSAVGIAGGLGLVQVLKVAFEAMGMGLSGAVPVDAATIVVSLLVGTLVSVLAAAVPARRAALVPPVEAMRDEVTVPERSMRVRAVLGLVVAGLGAAAVVTAVLRPTADVAEPALAGGAGAVVVGMLMLSPHLARWTVGVLAWPFVRLLRPMGRLARGNVVRNPRRTANTAGALMIGMALVGGVSVIAASAQSSLATIVAREADADLILQSATSAVPAEAAADVAALPEVGSADVVAFGSVAVTTADDAAGSSQTLVGVTPGTFGRSLDVRTIDGDLGTLADGDVAVLEAFAESEGLAVGDEVSVQVDGVTTALTVGAVFDSNALGVPLAVDQPVLDTILRTEDQQISTVFVTAAAGTDLATLRAAVADVVAPYVVVSVQDKDEFVSSLADQVDQVLVILYALLGLSIVIAVLGIVNTLALSVIERTREIGMLRAVGLGRLQLAATVTIESVLTAVFGTAVGLVVGVALASALPRVYADDGLSSLVVPWGSLVGMLVLAVVVGVLAALWPAARAARMRVLDAVGYE